MESQKSPCVECPFRLDLPPNVKVDALTGVANLRVHYCHLTVKVATTKGKLCRGKQIFDGKAEQHPKIPVATTLEELQAARGIAG